jgi:adenylate kinase family enzyme
MKFQDFVYDVDYTWMKTRTEATEGKEFDLLDPAQRRIYFNSKIGEELELLREFLKNNTFIAYLIAPKFAGKGTYTSMLMEAVGPEYFDVIKVGDIIEEYKAQYKDTGKDSEIYEFMQENYRGLMGLDEAFDAFTGSSQTKLAPTEFILSLIKKKIDEIGHKTIFLDGFPRKADQLAYSLYFRELVDYREDPDFFVLINLPLEVIDARIRERRMCPECRSPRNIRLLPTPEIEYDDEKGEFQLICDNPDCDHVKMQKKKRDKGGIDSIKERIESNLDLMDMGRKMYGIPKIELFNSLEKDKSELYVEDYELTKEFVHHYEDGEVITEKKPFVVEVNRKQYYSLLPAPVIIQYVRQLCHLFRLGE